MKLLLGLCLSSLFSSVYTLQCLQCESASGQCSTTNSTQCPTGSACFAQRTIFSASQLGASTSVIRSCLNQSVCSLLSATASGITYSAEVGVSSLFSFISCCNADNCNSITIPEPDNTLNGLKCATCNSLVDTVCNTTVSCVGNQDRCGIGTIPNQTFFGQLKGCVSKSVCETSQLGNFTCCSGNLCNGSEAWLRLNLSLLLMVLTAAILLQ